MKTPEMKWYDEEEKKSQTWIQYEKKYCWRQVPLDELCLVDEWNQTPELSQDLLIFKKRPSMDATN